MERRTKQVDFDAAARLRRLGNASSVPDLTNRRNSLTQCYLRHEAILAHYWIRGIILYMHWIIPGTVIFPTRARRD